MPPLLSCDRLCRRYHGVPVVDVDRLQLEAGEVLAVLGPNGSGKSTLFRLLLLLERADSGVIQLNGRVVSVGDREAGRHMAGVFQRPYLFAGTVRDNIEFGLGRLAPDERKRRVESTLADLDLGVLEQADVRSLSGGEAQRVALARALALEPDVLLLDEPTANLDVTIQRRFREDLGRVARQHARAVLLITHDPSDAFALADRVAVMEKGRVVQLDTPEQLVLHPRTPFVAAFTGAELLLDGRVLEVVESLVRVGIEPRGELWATAAEELAAGEPVQVTYRPEDVTLSALDARAELSARNVLRVRVVGMAPAGGLVRVALDGPVRLVAALTRLSAESMGLQPGREVNAHLKVAALRAFRSGAHT